MTQLWFDLHGVPGSFVRVAVAVGAATSCGRAADPAMDVEATDGSSTDAADVDTHGSSSSTTETVDRDCPAVPFHDGDGDITALSDEFNDPATICGWTFRHEVEDEAPQFDRFDIDETNPGHATMIPTASGWYGDWSGPLLYKRVRGNFIADAWVRADSLARPGQPPTLSFTSVGLLVRNPEHGPWRENWLMVDLGYQGAVYGHEGKNTIDSQSTLWTESGLVEGVVRICRVGDVFRLARRFDDEASFVTIREFSRPDMPALLQVGMIINAWNGTGSSPNFELDADLLATWDYVRFRPVDALDECVVP